MKSSRFTTLVGVAAVAVVLAGWAILSRPAMESSDFDGAVVFPDLLDSLNDLDRIVVRHKDGVETLEATDEGWVYVERDNYPVQGDKVGELVVKLSRLEKIEPKTKLAERYDRLDLADPEVKDDTRAKEVALIDSEGAEMARLLVGKRKFTLGSTEGGTYILVPDDPQAWLVTGELNPGTRARDWLVREITDIKDKDIQRIRIVHPDGEELVVYKETPEQANYAVENVPEDMVLRRDSIADDTGRVLSNLLLDDVKKAADVDFPADQTITATFLGFDGFTIDVDLIESGDENWLRFRGQAPQEVPASEVSGEEESGQVSKPNWADVIAELNAKADGWVYQLPGYEVAPLKKRMTDLVREPDEDGV
ncbi:MAG: DUF4340 domain-containing protein [Rhodospirillaceae bacterium]